MKMMRNIILVAVSFAVIIIVFQGLAVASTALNIKFGTKSATFDSLGYLHIFGEVENIGSQTYEYVKITGTFYDGGHVVIASEYTFTKLDQVILGQKSPFDLFIMNEATSAEVASYSLSLTADITNAKPPGLQILSHSSSIDELGYLEIVGEVRNVRIGSASYVEVIGTFYDQNGTVIGCDYTFTDPSDLSGGQTAPFKMTFMYESLSTDISTYALVTQSVEYSMIPEFSTPTLLAVLITATLAAAIYRRKHANFHTVITNSS